MTMNKFSSIYVAGHNGMVGSAIIRELRNQGYKNAFGASRSQLDLRDEGSVYQYFSENRPDYVFLAAAKVGGIKNNMENPADFICDNLRIQNNVIMSAYEWKVKKLLFLGSACIYPKVVPQPIKEEYLLTAPLEPSNEGYALAKIAGLKMCRFMNDQYNFNAISVMPANLYGEGDNFRIDQCHVIPGLFNRFHSAKLLDLPTVTCWGDGSPTREFMHVDDLASACVWLMNNYDDPNFLNVGTKDEITIYDLAMKIRDIVGYTGEIIWDTTMPNGTPRRKLDNSKLTALGWKPTVDLDTGLRRTYSWYKQNIERFAK